MTGNLRGMPHFCRHLGMESEQPRPREHTFSAFGGHSLAGLSPVAEEEAGPGDSQRAVSHSPQRSRSQTSSSVLEAALDPSAPLQLLPHNTPDTAFTRDRELRAASRVPGLETVIGRLQGPARWAVQDPISLRLS